MTNEQKVTSNEQRAKSNEQRATSEKFHFESDEVELLRLKMDKEQNFNKQ